MAEKDTCAGVYIGPISRTFMSADCSSLDEQSGFIETSISLCCNYSRCGSIAKLRGSQFVEVGESSMSIMTHGRINVRSIL